MNIIVRKTGHAGGATYREIIEGSRSILRAAGFSVLALCYPLCASAQQLTVLHSFDDTDGFANYTEAQLVQGANGELYGTTSIGGANGGGTVFSITSNGMLETLYDFCAQPACSDGVEPVAGLILANDGNFYGTTAVGGAHSQGTIFKLTPDGALTTLYSFCSTGLQRCPDGRNPWSPLIQATDGYLYGTTSAGGPSDAGTVFRITTGGELTTLYSFCSQPGCPDGADPEAGLIQGSDGNFYGTTSDGGDSAGADSLGGTIFKITPSGTFTLLYTFPYSPAGGFVAGQGPLGSLLQASDGTLYGTTDLGGTGEGVVFETTTTGATSVVWNFGASMYDRDGVSAGHLIQASDGNLYGTSFEGGYADAYPHYNQGGVIFELNAGGVSPLYTFTGLPNGESYPYAQFLQGDLPSRGGLLQATDGNFYGMTQNGGASAAVPYAQGYGTVFQFSTGLGPLVQTLTQAGLVGDSVNILGTNLNGATRVTFNGTPATFSVISPTQIATHVPEGATTGPILVVTPSGTLSTNAVYTVQTQPATPVFKPAAGTYSSVQSVSITDATPGSTIYYTLDGSVPTLFSPVYSAPISMGASNTLSAIALGPNDELSAINAAAYAIVLPAALNATLASSYVDVSGNYIENLVVSNSGGGPANSVALTAASLVVVQSGKAVTTTTSTGYSATPNSLAPGASTTLTLTFPASAGTAGAAGALRWSIGYSGGSASGTIRLALP